MNKCIQCATNFTPSKFRPSQKFCSSYCLKQHWAKNNPERVKHNRLNWIKTNPEKEKLIRTKYRSKPEAKLKRMLYAQQYYLQNKEKQYLYTRKWRSLNRARSVQQVLNRRYLVRGLPGSHTLEEWEQLKKKYNYLCADCGLKKPLTRDHIIPVTKPGSTNYISNIQPLCRPCNSHKFNHI